MKTLIITGTPRRQGNLAVYADIVARELAAAGQAVETLNLYDLKLVSCLSCDACRDSGRCVLRDAMSGLTEQLLAADLIIIGTPVYWFSVSGVVKNFMDRTQSLWHGHHLAGKACAALIVQAYSGADETASLLASFAKYHRMQWFGSSVVSTRDRRDLVRDTPELSQQARDFATGLLRLEAQR